MSETKPESPAPVVQVDQRCSESIKALAGALAKAQSEFPIVPKNKTAKVKMKAGGEYSYKYADLADVIACITPSLSKNGLAVSQDPTVRGGKLVLETTLMHETGEWKRAIYPLHTFDDPKLMGSEITYARRYTLCAMVGVHAEEDDDGGGAADAAKKGGRGASVGGNANQAPPKTPAKPSPAQLKSLLEAAEKNGWKKDDVTKAIGHAFKKKSGADISGEEYAMLLDWVKKFKPEQAKKEIDRELGVE